MKRWKINKPDNTVVSDILSKTDLSRLCAEVMTARGYSNFDDLVSFFNSGEIENPLMLKDMDVAVEAVSAAVERYDLICVYGDYDCDGVTATAVVYNYLECIGANIIYYIPERNEGYGLNRDAIDSLYNRGVKMIITVDNGISAIEEAEYLRELGIELVITDHHQPQDKLPYAKAVVNPHRTDCPSQFKELAGVGVALKLCAALDDGNYDMVMEQYGDIAAIGTVADAVPLSGENRTIVRRGLELMKNTENSGLNCLFDKCGVTADKLSSTAIAFMLAPKINAAGRFGSPLTAVRALLSEGEEASTEVETLINLNNMRKEAENVILEQVMETIRRNPQILNQRILIVSGQNWHHGVVGIVAARLCERFEKPCVLISIDSNQARGSARSIPGFNIFKCFSYCGEYLERFGGHECAGGLSLSTDNIDVFTKKAYEYASTIEKMPVMTLTADKLVSGNDLSVNAIKSLDIMEPFGVSNQQPVFLLHGAKVLRFVALSGGKHTKLELEYDGTLQSALAFGQSADNLGVRMGDIVDILVQASINVYNGRESVSLRIVDIRLAGVKQERYFAAKDCYEAYARGDNVSPQIKRKITPNRNELVEVYKAISTVKNITADKLFERLGSEQMNYFKFRICIDVFSELGLVNFNPANQTITYVENASKVDLSSSCVLKSLNT